MGDAEKLANVDRLCVALLVDGLRDGAPMQNRNQKVSGIARSLVDVRYTRMNRGGKQRSPLDSLIEELAML
jgi:hypothetical protein